MAGFGAKVRLSVDRSGAAKKEFNSQIHSLINQIRISDKFTVTKQDMNRVRKDAETMFNAKPLNVKLKIERIDCKQAVTKLRNDLQSIINSLSIKNGVSITGLVDPSGMGKLSTDVKNVSAELKEGEAAAARFKAQLTVLDASMSQLRSSYKTILPGGKNAADTAQLDDITQKYIDLQQKIEEVRQSGNVASEEKVAALQQESVAIQNAIAQINEERIAREQAGRTSAEVSKKRKSDDEEYKARLTKINNLIVQTKKNLESWTKAKGGKTSSEYSDVEGYLDALRNLRQAFIDAKIAGKDFEGALSNFDGTFGELEGNINKSSTAIKEAGENTKSFGDRIGGLSSKFASWLSVSQVIMAVYNALRKLVSAVTEIDSAMTELRKVTDETEATYERFVDRAADRARLLGATMSDTIKSTADFARLGYGIDDASALADAALVYKNVGDGIESVDQASESIISTMQAFGVEASNVMNIVDKFNIVGNNFAISSTGVGEALLNSASALAAAGNTLDESIALITAANEVIQNPEKVGTAMKTLSMYIRAAKTEAEEAGISTDGMANSISELREEILALTGNKVDIMIDDNTFKSTVDVLRELSQVWDSLTDTTRSNITELIGGGVRNANVIAALMSNFETVEEVLATSAESAGSALEENEKYLDSIEGKTAQFKATFEELANVLVGSEFVKQIVDFGIGVLNVLKSVSKLIDALGGLRNVLAITAGTILTIKADSIIGLFTKLGNIIPRVQRAVQIYNATAGSSATVLGRMAAGLHGVGIAASGAQIAFAAFTVVITAAIAAYQAYQQSIQEAIDKSNELIDAYDNAKDTYKSNKETLEGLREEFDKLSKGVDANGENISLTADEYETYLSLISQIVDISPDVCLGYDNEGRAILNYKSALDDAIASQEIYLENERNIYLGKGTDIFDGKTKEWNKGAKDLAVAGRAITNALSGAEDLSPDYDYFSADSAFSIFDNALRSVGIDWQSYTMDSAPGTFDSYNGTNSTEKVMAIYENYDKIMTLLRNAKDIKGQARFTEAELINIENAILGLAGAYTKLKVIETDQTDYLAEWSKGQEWYNDIPIGAVDEFKGILQDVNDPLKSYNDNVQNAAIVGKEFSDSISSENAKNIIELSKGLEDGSVSLETYNAAINEFKSSFTGSDSVLSALVEFFGSLSNVAKSADDDDGITYYTAQLTALTEVMSKMKSAYSALEEAEKEMADSQGLSIETIEKLAAAEENYLDYLYEENGVIKLNTQAWKDNANAKMLNEMAELEKEIASLVEANKALEEQNKVLDGVSDQYRTIKKLGKDTISEVGAEYEGVNSSIDDNSAAIDENNKAIEANNEKIRENQGLLALYGAIYNDITGDISAYNNALNNFANVAGVIDSVATSFASLANLQNTVADGFTLSLDKILEYAKAYPEILKYAQATADGELTLNEAVVNSFIEGKKAELNTQIDTEIAKLNADKAVLEAKKTYAETQLELVKSVGEGEGQIAKEVAQYKLDVGNALTEAMIDNGIDEAEAYRLAAAAMAGNLDEFSKVAREVCVDVDGNFSQSAYNAAMAMYKNANSMQNNLAKVAEQAHESAKAIRAAADGEIAGSSTVIDGLEFGVLNPTSDYDGYSGKFKGTDYTYTKKTIGLDDYIAQLELDISDFNNAIDQINGQIAVLEALKDTPFENFKNLVSNSSAIVGGKDTEEKTKIVEEYVAAIDQYYEALKRLEEVQKRRVSLEKKLEHTEDLSEKIFLSSGLIEAYREEAEAERNLMSAKQATISANVSALRSLGFQVSYNSATNELYIKNLEHLNELTAASAGEYGTLQEATNALRKETEELIKTTEQLNEDNAESAENLEDLSYAVLDIKNQIIDYIEEIYDKQVESYQKIIDLRKELIQSAKDEYDYESDVADKVKEIADLQARIDKLALDDSRSARAERAALEEELAEKQKDLASTQSSHATDEQLKALDKMADDYASQKSSEIESLRATVTSAEGVWDSFYQTILGKTVAVGETINSQISTAWINAAQAVNGYSSALGGLTAGGVLVGSVPKYHTGGVVSESNVGKNETLALLEKGEVVLNDGKQQTLYKIINFQEELSKRLGTLVGSLSLPDMFGGVRSMFNDVARNISSSSQGLVFEPHIEVEINHSGNMSNADAKSYGEQIAETAIDKLYDAFERRGISSTRAARLKP